MNKEKNVIMFNARYFHKEYEYTDTLNKIVIDIQL